MRKVIYAFVVICVALSSCEKQPGEGGKAFIRGKVMTEERTVLSNPASAQAQYPAADEDVFIIYGDNLSPDDRVNTNYDGEFEFRFLREGKYTIYVYSGDTTGQAGVDQNRMPIVLEVELNDRKEEKDLGTIWRYEDF